MGSNTLFTRSQGQKVRASDVNQFVTALIQALLPRDAAGAPIDATSELGSSSYRWLNAFISGALNIGASGSGLAIEEDSGDLIFKVGGSEVARMDSSGITLSSFPSTGVLKALKVETFTSSDTWAVPANVSNVLVWGCGGGGGGGGGGASGGSGGGGGGGGGAGVDALLKPMIVAPSETLTITVGGGGTPGAGVLNSAGNPGGTGGNSSVAGASDTITFRGAAGGNGGQPGTGSPAPGGNAVTPGRSRGHDYQTGGSGGQKLGGDIAANVGGSGFHASGGAAGTLPGGGGLNGGPGGGGGAGVGAGGAGGDGGSGGAGQAGSNGTSYGAGGGGGGGAASGVSTGASGGTGGGGIVRIFYVD